MRRPARSPVRTAATIAVLLATCVTATAACSDTPARTAEGYCGTIAEHLESLNSPAIATAVDIDDSIALYQLIADRAPAAVEPEWARLLGSLQTAATVVAADPASVQLAADTARAAQPAATRIQEYTLATCAVQIGAPAPAPPPATTVAVTTTLPG